MIRDATLSLISRPGKPDIVVLKCHRDSIDIREDIWKMIEEVWTARRSPFFPEPSPGQEDEVVDFAFGLHLGMTTAVPEFRAEKIAYRDGYERPCEDGVYIDKGYFQKLGLPESLEPGFDSDTAVARVKAAFPLGFGTGAALGKPDGKGLFDQSLVAILKKAIGAGFSHIDFADAYGTEEELGVAIRECGVPRERLFITTKVQDNVFNIPQAIDDSLKKLQLSYVDMYLIHATFFAKNDEHLQKAWKDMGQVKASGKAKSIGVSNYLRPHLEATLRTTISHPVINQIEFQPYLQRANQYVPWMQENGIQVMAFKGLALLTKGKGGPLDALLEALGKKYDVEPSAILFNWHNQQNVVAITTTRNPDRLAQYKKALAFSLTPSEMEEITQIGLSHHFRAAHQKNFDVNDRT